jgi:hypothetical protein
MVEVLGFFLVLAALALMIGTLAQGPLRMAGFIVLAFITVLASGPALQRTPIGNFFNPGATQFQSDDPVAPANLPSNPDLATPYYGGSSQSQSGTSGSGGGSTTIGGSTTSGGSTTNRGFTTNRGTSSTNSPNRSIRGGW